LFVQSLELKDMADSYKKIKSSRKELSILAVNFLTTSPYNGLDIFAILKIGYLLGMKYSQLCF
jgi:hypothetical protein